MGEKYITTEKQLDFLENYLKRKKKFIDSEDIYELMDHLINDFEATTKDGNLSQYLADKSNFISKFGSDRASKIHWAYQKELWYTFFSFFTKLKTLPITIFVTLVLIGLSFFLTKKQVTIIFMCSISFQLFYAIYLTWHKNKKVRKLISFKYLTNISSIPYLFIYLPSIFKDSVFDNRLFFIFYWLVALGLSISALIVIKTKKETILKKYKHLLN
ncbi:MAG: hypothetical protein ACPGU6_06940 [Tenacibaculum sp.]